MPFEDLRAYIRRLEEEGELIHVGQEVDWNEEVGAIIRRSNEMSLQAMMFDKVKDYPNWRLAGALMGTVRRVAIAMEMPPDTQSRMLVAEFNRRTNKPVAPVFVKTGPCKENVLLGEKVDLFALPAPLIHAGDGGRYLCTWHVNITKDPDSDWVNWGMYRSMILEKDKLSILASPQQHIGQMFYQKYEANGRPMEIAIAIGPEPMSAFCASASFPQGVSEVEMVGAMRGEPVELVPCETVDLHVPATAEIVIEGKVYPGERREEGPFGEYTGYRAPDCAPRPVVHVTAITHRSEPILTVSCEGIPVSDSHAPMAVAISAQIERELQRGGLPVTGAWVYPESSGYLVVVATKVPYANVAARIAHIVFGSKAGFSLPFLIVVEDDVDPYSWSQVMHALATRCHPYRGIRRFEYDLTNHLDPRLALSERRLALGAKAYFDCTWPVHWDRQDVPQVISFATAYSKGTQDKVLQNWGNYGFRSGR